MMVSINQETRRGSPEQPLFPLGKVVATQGVMAGVEMEEVFEALSRHEHGDWGLMPPKDKELNDQALKDGGRLVSKYCDSQGTEFYIITEADRALTTALLPSEY